MAAQALLNEDVQRGWNTLAALDAAGLDVRAAFWVFDEDNQDWRFTVAEPTVDRQETHALYERVALALQGRQDVLLLREIYAVSPDDGLVTLVGSAVSMPAQARTGISYRGNVVLGTSVPDMYIYRLGRTPVGMGRP